MTEARGATYPRLRSHLRDCVDSALGRAHRHDPVTGRSGGPAGNARLTAALGLVLLVLFLAELVTLLNVTGLITWHIAIGTLLVPPALVKTGSTGWRIVRYYTGARPYRQAGPPPLLLRVLGPLVVAGTLAVLGSGLALAALGPDLGRRQLVTVMGQPIDPLVLHQASFLAWGVVTGLHVLARTLPAIRLVGSASRRSGAGAGRGPLLISTLAVGVLAALIVLAMSRSWAGAPPHDGPDDGPDAASAPLLAPAQPGRQPSR